MKALTLKEFNTLRPYFSYISSAESQGFETHETEGEAKEYIKEAIERHEQDDEACIDLSGCYYGKLLGFINESKRIEELNNG